ncbi:GAF domain-containing protein [Salinimicrobium soli]|uniref:GAF domain-containing protein n=1 Tax=Salinimicrobium soli TaxID=1254399 RepID=UPI003AAEAF42
MPTTKELSEKIQQREAQLALLGSVQESLLARKEMSKIYHLVGDSIRELFDAEVTAISTFDHTNHLEVFQYIFEEGEEHHPAPRPIDKMRQLLIDNSDIIYLNEDADALWTKLTGEEPTVVPGTKLTKSAVYVPMTANGTVFGYISIQNLDRENAFSESDIRLLSTLAGSIGVSLENARLFNETEQRNAELAVINSVQQGLVAETDLQGIYDLVGDKIRDLFDAQVTGIDTYDPETGLEHFNYLYEDGQRYFPDPRPLSTLPKLMMKTGSLYLINQDLEAWYGKLTDGKFAPVPGTRSPKSALFVPLKIADEVRGCVTLQNLDRENAFSESDVRLLSTLASSMSVALENARLFNETEQRNAELAVINSVQEGLVAETGLQGIYDLVGDRLRDLFDAQVTGIYSFDIDAGIEHFHYLFEDGQRLYPKSRPLDKVREHIIKTKSTINITENLVEEVNKQFGIKAEAVPGTKLPKSFLMVPLIIGNSVTGAVTLQNLDKEHAFSDSDVRLLSTLANSMSVALENARLFSETEQRNAELAVINSVQEGLVAEMDLQGIYDLVGEKTRQLFDAQVVGIATFNYANQTEVFNYIFENGQRFYPDPRQINPMRQKMIDTHNMIVIRENAVEAFRELEGRDVEAIPGTGFPKSAVFVPMLLGDTVKGYVTLQNLDHENAFNDADIRLLSTLVNSMSVALENARLFNETTRLLAETEKRNSELEIINNVQEGLVREMDMEAIYREVGDRICEVLNTQTLIIRTFDHKTGLEHWEYAIENGKRIDSAPRPFIWANQQLIKNKESLLINENYLETAQKYGGRGFTEGQVPKSAIFVPMIVGEEIKGSVSLQNIKKEHAFNEDDVRLLTTLTNSMSFAIENARLFNETTRLLGETERRAAELHTVNNISKAIVSQLELKNLIELVGEQMRKTFNADIVYLALHDRSTGMLHFPYYYGDRSASRKFGNGITEKIIINREPLLVNQNLDEVYEKMQAEKKGKSVASYLGVPIMVGSEAIGVISVQSKEQNNRFTENDEHLLTTIAANVGIAIQNAETYQKMKAALNDLKSAQNQLVQQEKLASLGQLTAGIAHEIKNPLNFVNNFSDVSIELIDEAKEEIAEAKNSAAANGQLKVFEDLLELLTAVEANLRKIHEHGTRADMIVKSMLQHSRGGTGKMMPTDLNLLIREYVNLAFHGMRAGKKPINVNIELDLDESLEKIPLVSEDFSRVILNLCNNAFDAEREKLQTSSYTPRLIVRTRQHNNRVFIEVEDNGPGIPDNIKDKILQPFFTTKKGTEGTGLGLSITNDIMKAHGGTLNIETAPGEGTRFILELSSQKPVNVQMT